MRPTREPTYWCTRTIEVAVRRLSEHDVSRQEAILDEVIASEFIEDMEVIKFHPEVIKLRLAADLREAAERQIRLLVTQAIASGCSWRDVGDALGVTPQAAHQRYGVQPTDTTAPPVGG